MRLIDADALIDDIKSEAEKAINEGDNAGSFWLGYIAGLVSIQPTAQPYTAEEIQKMQELESAQLEKAYELGRESAQPEQRWIPCNEQLPDNRVSVIVCYREWQQYAKRYIYCIVIGWYARKHSVRENVFSEWEADCDYDEDEDEFYIHEGWYELTTQGNADLMNWYINAEVVAWMPLPEPYKVGRNE